MHQAIPSVRPGINNDDRYLPQTSRKQIAVISQQLRLGADGYSLQIPSDPGAGELSPFFHWDIIARVVSKVYLARTCNLLIGI
jgi:hypothetical protein